MYGAVAAPMHSQPADAPPRRRGLALFAGAAVVLALACAGIVASTPREPAAAADLSHGKHGEHGEHSAHSEHNHSGTHHGSSHHEKHSLHGHGERHVDHSAHDEDDDAPVTEIHIPMSKFTSDEKVKKFLASQGIDKHSPEHEVLRYVPRSIVLQVWPSRVRGTIGAVAEDGYFAFNIVYLNGTGPYTASYLIVTDLYGANMTIEPTLWDLGYDINPPERIHFCGLKLRDPDHLLLAGDNSTNEAGPAYLWNWRSHEYTPLAAGAMHNCRESRATPLRPPRPRFLRATQALAAHARARSLAPSRTALARMRVHRRYSVVAHVPGRERRVLGPGTLRARPPLSPVPAARI